MWRNAGPASKPQTIPALFQINAPTALAPDTDGRTAPDSGAGSRKDKRMIKIAILVWMMLGTALAGSAMIAVLSIGELASQPMKFIPIAVLGGFVAAMPISYLIARKIGRPATA
jgi:hypothetical protein